jgi:hypothetical protein
MQLTTEQERSLDEGESVRIVVNGRECVLIQAHVFEAQRRLLSEWTPDMMQRQMARTMADDWSDPAMNVYDEE